MKRVVVIQKFKDLEHNEEIRELNQVLVVEDARAKELLKKKFVKELVEIDLTNKKKVKEKKE